MKKNMCYCLHTLTCLRDRKEWRNTGRRNLRDSRDIDGNVDSLHASFILCNHCVFASCIRLRILDYQGVHCLLFDDLLQEEVSRSFPNCNMYFVYHNKCFNAIISAFLLSLSLNLFLSLPFCFSLSL